MERQALDITVNCRTIWIQSAVFVVALHAAGLWLLWNGSQEGKEPVSASGAEVAEEEQVEIPGLSEEVETASVSERASEVRPVASEVRPVAPEIRPVAAVTPVAAAHPSVPVADTSRAGVREADGAATDGGNSQSETEEYVVRRGDNLSTIARRHGCTTAELAVMNESTVAKLERLAIGQKLRVPVKAP